MGACHLFKLLKLTGVFNFIHILVFHCYNYHLLILIHRIDESIVSRKEVDTSSLQGSCNKDVEIIR